MNRLLRSKKRGSAIPLALVAVVILLAMGTGLLSLGYNSRLYSIRTTSEIAARCAADAGMTQALFEMNEKLKVKPWNGSSLPEATSVSLPNCDATFSYTVTGDPVSGYIVESTGICGQIERKVIGTLEAQGPFEFAVFGDQGIELKNSAVVDWYNYGADDNNLKVGTNSIASGAVILRNSAAVNGDVLVGVSGNPSVVINNYGATITGESRAMTQRNLLPPVTAPQWLQSLPSSGNLTKGITIYNSAKYSSINLKTKETLEIDGDVALYIVGQTILNKSVELQIKNDSSLILYLGGDFEGKNSTKINNKTQDPKKLQIYCLDSCEDMRFKNSSDLYGVIYAPNADIIMDNSASLYGAVIAKSFEQRNSATLNYDASLRDANVNDEAVRFTITNWHEQ